MFVELSNTELTVSNDTFVKYLAEQGFQVSARDNNIVSIEWVYNDNTPYCIGRVNTDKNHPYDLAEQTYLTTCEVLGSPSFIGYAERVRNDIIEIHKLTSEFLKRRNNL